MDIVKEKNFEVIIEFLKTNFSSPTHWPDWNLVVSEFFNTEFFYLCAYEEDELIGICPMHKYKKGIYTYYRSGQFMYIPFGGWLLSRPNKINYNAIQIKGLSRLDVFGLPLISDFENAIIEDNVVIHKTLIIDLNEDINNIWDNYLNKNRRKMINKAQKNDVVVEVEDDLDRFYYFYKRASIRKGIYVLPKFFFERLIFNAVNINFDFIWTKIGDQYFVNRVIAYDKNYAIAWLANYEANIPNLGLGEVLYWEAIKRVKQFGCDFFDLAYINKKNLPGIYEFKRGFSQKEVIVPLIIQKPLVYRVVNRGTRWLRSIIGN